MPDELVNERLSPLLPANPDQPVALVVQEEELRFVAKVPGAVVYGFVKMSTAPKS